VFFDAQETAMLIGDLTDHEIGLLVVALKYWRGQRAHSATRRHDPVLSPDTVDVLLAKLEPATLGAYSSSDESAADLFHR
jgi:hypothetical protein